MGHMETKMCILGVWICIWMFGLLFWASGLAFGRLDLNFRFSPTSPWSMILPQAFFLKNDDPGSFEHVLGQFAQSSPI
jgi:hypothetical protein